jgi:HK97 family phage major capsid protein
MTTNVENLVKSIHDLREIVETKGKDSAEAKEMIAKVAERQDQLEAENQKALASLAQKEKEEKEINDKLEVLEKQLSRMGAGEAKKASYKDSPSYKAFNALLRTPKDAHLPDETKSYIQTNIDPQGGYLVPQELSNELLKNIIEISPVRAYARVRQTSTGTLTIALRNDTIPTTTPTAQATAQASATTSSYQTFAIVANKMVSQVGITMEAMQDPLFDMEQEMRQDVEISINKQEGYQFIKGSGASSEAQGIMTASGVSSYESENSGTITFDDMINLANIKVGYKLVYAFNRDTKIFLQTLKDNMGRYYWNPEIANGAAVTINGFNYIIMQDMDDIAASAYPVVCGDFYQGYTLADKPGMSIIRDDVTQALQGITLFTFTRRTGGNVVKPEAFLKLQVKA